MNGQHGFSHVCVMGMGYIGLPTATLIASRGVRVTGVDKNPHVVETVNDGRIHIVEPDLEGLVAKVIKDKQLVAVDAAVPADVFMVTVPTPITDDKAPDMRYVHAAVEEIAGQLQPGNLVIIESTSPVGTTMEAAHMLAEKRPDLTFPHTHGEESDIRMAYCPERVLPGQIIMELMYNDRIIGGMTPRCMQLAESCYQIFVRGNCFSAIDKVAELVKLSENAYRDVNIAFANELANVCEQHGLNAWDVIQLANCHPRVNILNPGPGVGGHCIPIDPWFIVHGSPEVTPLIQAARRINDLRPQQVVDSVLEQLKHKPDAVVACLGLAYKPNVDDLRESPALHIVQALAEQVNGKLLISEPNIEALPESLAKLPNVSFCDGLSAVSDADVVVALVPHRGFTFINKTAMSDKVVLDYAGLWR